MVTVFITYAGEQDTWFNRDYYVRAHLPLVREAWCPYGLDSIAAFFPEGEGGGLIAIACCVFRDDSAIDAALSSPEAAHVIKDRMNYTNVQPVRSRSVPL